MAGETPSPTPTPTPAPAPSPTPTPTPAPTPSPTLASSLLGGEPSKEGTAPAPTEAPKNGAVSDIELKLPDGFEADEKLVGDFKSAAKELGLKSDGAQKIFDLYAGAQAQAAKVQTEAIAKQRAEWVAAVKADKDIGGDKLHASLLAANKAVNEFGGSELHALLNATGLGDHPLLVRAFAKAGALLAEDSIAGTTGGAPAGDTEAAFHAELYPTMKKQG